jgi:hypothetical protein
MKGDVPMNTHPYLRAYMAGVVLPSVFVLAILAFFLVARYGYAVDVPIERIVVFPLALIPFLWGVWNMVFLSMHSRRWLPLGIHGALLPVVLLPIAFLLAQPQLARYAFPFAAAFWVALPGVTIVYYLVWKYLVAFFNRVLGIA